jgi:hypothetical protein
MATTAEAVFDGATAVAECNATGDRRDRQWRYPADAWHELCRKPDTFVLVEPLASPTCFATLDDAKHRTVALDPATHDLAAVYDRLVTRGNYERPLVFSATASSVSSVSAAAAAAAAAMPTSGAAATDGVAAVASTDTCVSVPTPPVPLTEHCRYTGTLSVLDV